MKYEDIEYEVAYFYWLCQGYKSLPTGEDANKSIQNTIRKRLQLLENSHLVKKYTEKEIFEKYRNNDTFDEFNSWQVDWIIQFCKDINLLKE